MSFIDPDYDKPSEVLALLILVTFVLLLLLTR